MKKVFITSTPNADTRSAKGEMTVDAVRKDTNLHIIAVRNVLHALAEELMGIGDKHDYSKIDNIDEFTEALNNHFNGVEKIKDTEWWQKHLEERHHLSDRVPDDVNLLDVIEMIVDGVCAGKARTGDVYAIELDNDILQKAMRNTQELLVNNVEAREPIKEPEETVVDAGPTNPQTYQEVFDTVKEKYEHRDHDIYYYDVETKEVIKGVNILPHEPEHKKIKYRLIYIGDEKTMKKFHEELGIDEFYSSRYSESRVACVGKNNKTGEWFGWSHRGYGKFYPGFVVNEGSLLADKFAAGYSPQTDEHCELMAEVFADLLD